MRLGFVVLVAISSFSGVAVEATSAPPVSTPLPTVSGPLPVTATSYPWNAADHNATPLNLASVGYQESEYLVSGVANVYTWSAGNTAVVQTPNAPYTSRMLVRRPTNVAQFSGNVVFEVLNASYAYDVEFLWPASHEYLIARGDAWVGLTTRPSSIRALKQFDPQRYAAVSMANPVPAAATCSTPSDMGSPSTENGLAYDLISQAGALIQGNAAASPLAGLRVDKVYATGFSGAANALQIYVNALSSSASMPDGSPIFEGYLIVAPVGGVAGSINQCAPWLAPGDPRIVVQPNRVPILRVNTLSDFGWWFAGPPGQGFSAGSTLNRRADSDAPTDRFREYEIPGATHMWLYPTAFMPGAAEVARIGAATVTYPFPEQPGNSFPLQYFLDGAFDNLDAWVRYGTLPPSAARISLNNAGTASESAIVDEYGNALGGVRSPYLDVPTATYAWFSPCYGCGAWGRTLPLSQTKLTSASMYSSRLAYESRFIDATFQLVANRWVPEMDGRKMLLDMIQSPPVG